MPARRGPRRPGGPLRPRALPLGYHGSPRRGPAGSLGDVPSRVLVDGRNVQHALARAAGAGDLPTAALVGRLRAAFSPPTEVELILDGHAGRSPQGRVAPGFQVVFARGATADEVIGARVTEAFRVLGAAGAWSVLVVTDDREVRDHARASGVRVEGTAWLVERLASSARGSGGPGGRSIGHPAPPRAPRG